MNGCFWPCFLTGAYLEWSCCIFCIFFCYVHNNFSGNLGYQQTGKPGVLLWMPTPCKCALLCTDTIQSPTPYKIPAPVGTKERVFMKHKQRKKPSYTEKQKKQINQCQSGSTSNPHSPNAVWNYYNMQKKSWQLSKN